MKQKINIKKFIDKHSEAIAVTVSGVAIIVAFTLGHKIGRHVGEADCNRLWNEAYQVVSVADFYDLVGVSGNYTDNKYGWTDIRNASVIRVRDGYMIKLPKALPLN